MASKFQRRQAWWIKFRHPATGTIIRESLETTDEARAELLRQRLDLEAALLAPRFQAVEIPQRIREALGMPGVVCGQEQPRVMAPEFSPHPPGVHMMAAKKRTTLDEAVAAYLRFIAFENAPLHVANKVSILRRFMGADRVEKAGGPVKTKRRRLENGEPVSDPPPFFTGAFLDEITPSLVRDFVEGSNLGKRTMRHYREMFHHLFEVCLKLDLYHPTNWHRPNPISALPSYASKNRQIVFLTAADVAEQIAALECDPAVQMAATIMIHAGLRRAETLWLTTDSIAPDLSFLSVRNRRDDESDIESSLKTGERTVTILPPLRSALERYLPTLSGKWIIPTPTEGRRRFKSGRWRPDSFSKRLRYLNQKAGLKWTCLPFRHTYATQRASESWSLFRIAKEMGNSVAAVEEYYAGFIRPEMTTAA